MKKLALAIITIILLVTLAAAGCAEKEPTVVPGEGIVSSCVGCHTDKDILQAVATPEEEEKSEATTGEG